MLILDLDIPIGILEMIIDNLSTKSVMTASLTSKSVCHCLLVRILFDPNECYVNVVFHCVNVNCEEDTEKVCNA